MRPMRPLPGGAYVFLVLLVFLVLSLIAASSPARAQTIFAGFEHQATGVATLSVAQDFSSLSIGNLDASGGGVTYQLDAEAGSITFGDGLSGSRPTAGGWNVQGSYRYGGGQTGGISGTASVANLDLLFDFTPLTSAAVAGVISVLAIPQLDAQFPPSVDLFMQQWPDEVALLIEDGELVLRARWAAPIQVVLADGQSYPCDEAVFRSQTGGLLSGEEIGQMAWEGYGLGTVEFLGESFLEDGDWYEVAGNLLLTRTALGHELSHVLQQGPAGTVKVQPPDPCVDPGGERVVKVDGISIKQVLVQAAPEVGTRIEFIDDMRLPDGGLARIPTHSAEWTNYSGSDPGMTITGGFVELGASTYTVQVFDDGLLVDQETGLSGEVARTKLWRMQHNQTNLDFVNQRASAQIDLGEEVDITLLAAVPRHVLGDRIHIIPEQLQVFPDCVEAVEMSLYRVSDITLKRGVVGVPVPPARVFGLAQQAVGDAVLSMSNGMLHVTNGAWGPGATGPLVGGVRTPVNGLEGFGWEFAGDLVPANLPPGAERLIRVRALDAGGIELFGGLTVGVENGQFAIGADFGELGSPDPQVDAWLGTQPVYSGVIPQQSRIFVDADFNEARVTDPGDGSVGFELSWDSPQTLLIDGQPVMATRVSERLRHKNRAVTLWDFEQLTTGTAATEVHRASVRPHGAWMSALGDVDFGDPAADPLVLSHFDAVAQTGVEVEAEPDPQGNFFFALEIEDPAIGNALDGDEGLYFFIQEEDADTGAAKRAVYAPGIVSFGILGGEWQVDVDFAAAGYTGFRVLADGAGELFDSSVPTGAAASCAGWPATQLVQGIGDELWIRLGFAVPTVVTTPGSGPVTTDELTVIVSGASHAPFPGGNVQVLSEGLETTVLPRSSVVVSAPPQDAPGAARGVVLGQARPNPFNPSTTVRYSLPGPMPVELSVYDLAGRRVARLVQREQDGPAWHEVEWNGVDDAGHAVASGVYLFRLNTPTFSQVRKVALVK